MGRCGYSASLPQLRERGRRAGSDVSAGKFWLASFLVAAGLLVLTRWQIQNEYFFFAAYVVLQYVVLATAWNILGGYTGYTNFGTGAFFAFGAYSSVVLHKLTSVPVPVMILVAGAVSGLLGFGMGYLTLRLKGRVFSIATLALAIVAQTLIVNWDYVGGSRGIYIIRPQQAPLFGGYIQYLYSLMLLLSWVSVAIARTIERSRLGLGLAAIRDDEQAAEASGVPTLRLKLIATTMQRRADGHGRGAVTLLRDLSRPDFELQPVLRGQRGGDAADRRHDQLDRPDHRRGPARHDPAGGDGDDLIGAEPADRRAAADRLCHRRAQRDRRAGRGAAPPAGAAMAEPAPPPLLEASGLAKHFGGFVALDNIDLAVAEGERLGLIGPNGSGKSTLVNCLCGTLRHDSGSDHVRRPPARSLLGL